METELDFNPMVSPHREDPHLFYRAARERPVRFSQSIGAYMVSRYADVTAVLDDPRTYSSSASLPWIYDNPPEVVAELKAGNVPETTVLVNTDPPAHEHVRALTEAAFSGARVRALLPLMHQRADELVDAFTPGATTDLVSAYAGPFVQTVIGAAIGFPPEDAAKVHAWTEDLNLLWNHFVPVEDRVAAARRLGDYTRYLQALIDERRARPRDDMISTLIHGIDGYPGLSDDYLHNYIRGKRVAGLDTTRDAITATVLLALRDPSVRAQIAADPTRTIVKVVEEALRRDAPHRGLFRITTREVELGGTLLPKGSLLLLLFGSANRDPSVFPDPDAVDLERPNVRGHVAFGKGLHYCPGAPLARAEIRVAVETLFARLPDLRLADGYEPTYIASYFFRGLESLDVVTAN